MTGGGDPSSGKHEAFRARGERLVGPATIFGPGVVGFDPTLGRLGTSMLPMPPSNQASLGRPTDDTLSGSGISQVQHYWSSGMKSRDVCMCVLTAQDASCLAGCICQPHLARRAHGSLFLTQAAARFYTWHSHAAYGTLKKVRVQPPCQTAEWSVWHVRCTCFQRCSQDSRRGPRQAWAPIWECLGSPPLPLIWLQMQNARGW